MTLVYIKAGNSPIFDSTSSQNPYSIIILCLMTHPSAQRY